MPEHEHYSDLRGAVQAAIASWVNHPYLVLPGPTALAGEVSSTSGYPTNSGRRAEFPGGPILGPASTR